MWVNGWGDFVSVDGDNLAKGYDFTTGGVSVGVDYRMMNHLAIGVFGSYAHTWTDLKPGDIDVNTGRGGLRYLLESGFLRQRERVRWLQSL